VFFDPKMSEKDNSTDPPKQLFNNNARPISAVINSSPPPIASPKAGFVKKPLVNIGPIKYVPNVLYISERQRGNPVVKFIKNVKFEFDPQLIPDYHLGSTACGLFLSLRYHLLNGDYLLRRLKDIPAKYRLRVLVCLVDTDENAVPLRQLNKLCIASNLTMIVAWSNLEVARYIETYKALEGKSADTIKEQVKDDYEAQLTDCLTAVRSINKRNVQSLAQNIGSLKAVMTAPIEQLSLCPGLGEKRVRRLYDAFHKPFVGSNSPIKKKRPSLDEFVFKANKKQNVNNSAATNKNNNNNNESDEKNGVVVMEDDEKEVKK
jgi:DNA excision repair protein ERCC-1